MPERLLHPEFFDRDPQVVACDLIGKVLTHRVDGLPLRAMIVETEAYYLDEKASHASLGYTEKRRALFMAPGTVYMYYARGGDSFNVSCAGAGNAVLVKAGRPYLGEHAPGGNGATPEAETMLDAMLRRNPRPSGGTRPPHRLCAGQTLLCRALGLRVPDWDGRPVDTSPLALHDVGYRPTEIVRTTRLGIPHGRDGHLPYRFVDAGHIASATHNPLARGRVEGRDFERLQPPAAAQAGAPRPGWEELLHRPHQEG